MIIPKQVQNILTEIQGKTLTFSTKELVYKDSEGKSYGRHEISWAVDNGLVLKTFSRKRLVWEFRINNENKS